MFNNYIGNYVTVRGFSMIPTLLLDDKLVIKKQDYYESGDILVYTYGERILVHRLLKIVGNIYVCKGDNSFRVEEIFFQQIMGKVIIIKRKNKVFQPSDIPGEFIELSLKVNKQFIENRCDISTTTKSDTYRKYLNLRGKICKR